MTIPLEQAQRQLADLLDRVAKGEVMVITRDGRAVARLIAEPQAANGSSAASPTPNRRLGTAKGQIHIAPDFDEPLDEFREYTG